MFILKMSISLDYIFAILLLVKIIIAFTNKIINIYKEFKEFFNSIILAIYKIFKIFQLIAILVIISFETVLTINFIDYKINNYFNTIKIKFAEKSQLTIKIRNHRISVPIFIVDNKNFFDCEISIINVFTNESRKFKFLIYKNFINKINIYLNNNLDKYFSSEIIFYGEINKVKLKGYEYDKFNLNKRLRCTIVNMQETKLFELIKDNNNYNDKLNLEIPQILSKNKNKNFLINIFIGNNKSNVLIFNEEEQILILATKEEKDIFTKLCEDVMKKTKDEFIINNLCKSFCDSLLLRTKLFGFKLIDIISINTILISFLNQGINCLLDKNIINEKDKDFIVGCLIIILYINKKKHLISLGEIKKLNEIIDIMKISGFNEIDQIKALIAYISFYTKIPYVHTLKITKELNKDSPYKKAFNFYESIINELNEDSELLLIFLQLNSGSGRELLINKNCYKISMLSISEIKEHVKKNIPKYFFCFNKIDGENIAMSDQRTQIIAFNEQEIFLQNNNQISENEMNDNETMNVVIGLFHEGGHQKFHMNIKIGPKIEPIMFITKDYELLSQENFVPLNNNDKNGESGMCVDFYLYKFNYYPAQILVNSYKSFKLMNKKYFIHKLTDLNEIALNIINDYIKSKGNLNKTSNNSSGPDELDDLKNMVKNIFKNNNEKVEKKYINVNGKNFPCTLDVCY